MKLYEITAEIRKILSNVDENGELLPGMFEAFAELNLAKEEKLENTALYYKEILAEAEAIKKEEGVLKQRRKVKENQAENLKAYIDMNLEGQALETARVKLSYRKSTSVHITDEHIIPSDYKEKQPDKIVKSLISKGLKQGIKIPGAELQERQNLQIK